MRPIHILASLVIFGGALYLYGCDSASGVESLELDLTANERNGTQSCIIWYESGPEGLNQYCYGPIESPTCGEGGLFTCRWRIGSYWVDQSDVYLSEEVGEIEGAPNSSCTGQRCHFHCSDWNTNGTCPDSKTTWYGDCVAGVGDTQCH